MKYCHSITLSFFLLFSITAFSQSRPDIDSLKTKIQHDTSDTTKVKLLSKLAGIYENINRDSSIYFLNNALKTARGLEEPNYKAEIYTKLGRNYCYKGEYLQSLEYLDLAENIVLEHPNKPILADIYYYRSLVFLHLDKLQDANEQATKALGLYQEQDNINMTRGVYTLYCYIFEGLGDFDRSLEFSLKSYNVSVQMNDSVKISGALNNVGSRYYLLGKIDSALVYVRKAILLNKKYNNKVWLAINYHNLAEFYVKLQETDSAAIYIQKASELYHEAGHMMNYYLTQQIRAKIALAENDTLTAVQYYKSIIESPKNLENLKIKTIAYKALYDIAFKSKQYVLANDYFKSYKQFDDSLKKETSTSLLSLLEFQMEYEKNRNRLELENKEVKLKSQKKSFYLFIMTGVILLLGLTIYFVYSLQRARARSIEIENKRIEQELEFKNRQMTTNVMSLMKKNEILSELSQSLLDIEKNAVKEETKSAINKIAIKIQKTRDTEIWEEFNVRFNEVHSSFNSNLLIQFPDLSPSEQRLCAFLRMNMSTKEISELSGITPRSINNSRTRIRKKIGLSSEDNLVSFLSKI